jgi:hypothetical protein
MDPVQSEKTDEDEVDSYGEAHDPGRDHQEHSLGQGSDRQYRACSVARPALAKHLIASAKEGVVSVDASTEGGLPHLVSLAPEAPAGVASSGVDPRQKMTVVAVVQPRRLKGHARIKDFRLEHPLSASRANSR